VTWRLKHCPPHHPSASFRPSQARAPSPLGSRFAFLAVPLPARGTVRSLFPTGSTRPRPLDHLANHIGHRWLARRSVPRKPFGCPLSSRPPNPFFSCLSQGPVSGRFRGEMHCPASYATTVVRGPAWRGTFSRAFRRPSRLSSWLLLPLLLVFLVLSSGSLTSGARIAPSGRAPHQHGAETSAGEPIGALFWRPVSGALCIAGACCRDVATARPIGTEPARRCLSLAHRARFMRSSRLGSASKARFGDRSGSARADIAFLPKMTGAIFEFGPRRVAPESSYPAAGAGNLSWSPCSGATRAGCAVCDVGPSCASEFLTRWRRHAGASDRSGDGPAVRAREGVRVFVPAIAVV